MPEQVALALTTNNNDYMVEIYIDSIDQWRPVFESSKMEVNPGQRARNKFANYVTLHDNRALRLVRNEKVVAHYSPITGATRWFPLNDARDRNDPDVSGNSGCGTGNQSCESGSGESEVASYGYGSSSRPSK